MKGRSTSVISIRLEDDLLEKVRSAIERRGTSTSEFVEWLFKSYLDCEEKALSFGRESNRSRMSNVKKKSTDHIFRSVLDSHVRKLSKEYSSIAKDIAKVSLPGKSGVKEYLSKDSVIVSDDDETIEILNEDGF